MLAAIIIMSPNVNKTEELFTGLYEIRASTMSVVSASFVLTVINMLMAYGVIWYDRYGIDMKRTLMNKLVTSICWASIINIPLLQVPVSPIYATCDYFAKTHLNKNTTHWFGF